ncbi:hypothetical protein CC1G_07853 [Coprinopsis cinerea okayama7|uniref:Uncharacterized protein n=1 Tax=Coprinopsis cinerea (strain Okayama-7 / 130 / ATCC MYA-4618 / FGSC 9003) TaxID=240176 RepID=A8P425_COPC7|nr:hypothetical protein CC1G_07853 [Coprinopsis cinerea okayama7\|eukprot:XP_001838662.1 hypothetical protein CC1G_07853 [Coprinopsis cinerea okayama7\
MVQHKCGHRFTTTTPLDDERIDCESSACQRSRLHRADHWCEQRRCNGKKPDIVPRKVTKVDTKCASCIKKGDFKAKMEGGQTVEDGMFQFDDEDHFKKPQCHY